MNKRLKSQLVKQHISPITKKGEKVSTLARSKGSTAKNINIPARAQSSRADCFGDWSSRNQICSLKYEIPNPFGDPNVNIGDFLNWAVKPSESGDYIQCFRDSFGTLMDCMLQTIETSDCIFDYTDLGNRIHHFPCDQECTLANHEVKKIYGCDGYYPDRTKDPTQNTSKGIVNTCNVDDPNWCQCPFESRWNPVSTRCECENENYVPYYGARRGDNTFEIGYCAPPCENDEMYDLNQQECVRKPQWY